MTTEITTNIKKIKRTLSALFAVIVLIIMPALIYYHHKPIAFGILFGFCLGSINLSLLIWTGTKIINSPPAKAHSFSMFMTMARVALFALGVGIILTKRETIDPISCVITGYLVYQTLAFKEVYTYLRGK